MDLTEIKARLESIAANKAPTTSYSVAFDLPGAGLYDPQHYADYLRPPTSEDDPLWYVCAPMRPSRPDAVPVACITGNGPNGQAHAELFAHAFADLNALVAEVEALQEELEEAKSEIDRLNWSIHSLKYVFPLR